MTLNQRMRALLDHPIVRMRELVDLKIQTRLKQRRIDFIVKILPKGGVGGELGVYKGHLSGMLFHYTNSRKLHLIDPWYMLQPNWDWGAGNQSTVDGLIGILKRYKHYIEQGRMVVHVGDDCEVLASFPDQYFDWVYIDSSHEYDHTKRELELLSRKVKHDGVIAGDDWQPEQHHRHHGVYKAVTEFMEGNSYELIYSNAENLQWAIKRSNGPNPGFQEVSPARSPN